MPATKAEIEPISFYSKGSERQPFSNFLNSVSLWTVQAVGLLGAAGIIRDYSLSGEMLKDVGGIIAVSFGTFRALDKLRRMYNEGSQDVREQTLQRVSEVRQNPRLIFRRTDQPTSAS